MPNYSKEKKDEYGALLRPQPSDVDLMITRAKNPKERFIIALQYLLGRRPVELLELRKKHFIEMPMFVRIYLFTAKLAKAAKTHNKWHFIEIKKDNPYLPHIMNYVNSFTNLETPLLPITTRTIGRIINRTSDKRFSPYHFRHNRVMWLIENNHALLTVMRFHNRASAQSVSDYIAKNVPIGRDMDIR